MMTVHPSVDDLSSFLAGEQPEIEEHLSLCSSCRSRLVDVRFAPADQPLPAELLAQAKRLGRASARPTWMSPWKWATAAMFTLALVGLSVMRVQRGREDVTRDVAPRTEVLRLLEPDDGAHGATELRWTSAAGAMRYEVRVLDARGDVMAEESATEPRLSLARTAGRLHKGESYFWSVRARWPDGRIADSEIRSFVFD